MSLGTEKPMIKQLERLDKGQPTLCSDEISKLSFIVTKDRKCTFPLVFDIVL